jgi:nucleoside-diphosphate-sugar epimerase
MSCSLNLSNGLERDKTMRILVTGANGYIGRNLCPVLQQSGFLVRGAIRQRSVPLTGADQSVEIGEICESTDWRAAVEEVDVVVHLAARVHIMRETGTQALGLFRKVNVCGTEGLAREALRAGVKRLVFVSSVKVNGEGRCAPYSEKDTPKPEGGYAISKQEAEVVLKQVAKDTNLEIVILRSPLVYGQRSSGNFLRLIKLIKKGIPLPLANLNNLRSFIFIGNLVDAITTCVNHRLAAGETFLVSDGMNISTTQLLRAMASASRKRVILFPVPLVLLKVCLTAIGMGKEFDRLTGSLCVDTSKIKNMLAWKPPFTVYEGLAEALKDL